MSLAFATPPDRMNRQELAVEASKLRQRRFGGLSDAEIARLRAIEAEMNKRSMGKR